MIEITKDKKSPTWIITKTDAEGFHHQLSLTLEDMIDLITQANRIVSLDTWNKMNDEMLKTVREVNDVLMGKTKDSPSIQNKDLRKIKFLDK